MYDLALDAFRDRQGRPRSCLPQNVSSLVVYYNRDLFEAAGVPLPTAGWTWDDMTAAAAALRDGEQYGLGVEASIIRLAPFVWSNGGDIVDDPAEPTRLTLDTPEALDALEKFLALGTDGLIPTVEESAAEDDEARFANGRLAMYLEFPAGDAAVPVDHRLRVGRRPVARARRARRRAALRRLLHDRRLRAPRRRVRVPRVRPRPGGAPVIARTGRTVPSLRSVAESDAFLDPSQPPASSAVFLDTIPAIRPAADDLHVAGDRGRGQRDPRGGAGRRHAGRRGGRAASTRRHATCSPGPSRWPA